MATHQTIPDAIFKQLGEQPVLQMIEGKTFTRILRAVLDADSHVVGFLVSHHEWTRDEVSGTPIGGGEVEHFFIEKLSDAYPFFTDVTEKA